MVEQGRREGESPWLFSKINELRMARIAAISGWRIIKSPDPDAPPCSKKEWIIGSRVDDVKSLVPGGCELVIITNFASSELDYKTYAMLVYMHFDNENIGSSGPFDVGRISKVQIDEASGRVVFTGANSTRISIWDGGIEISSPTQSLTFKTKSKVSTNPT